MKLELPHRITAENAQQIWGWFQARGGISLWASVDLSDPGRTWTCPLRGPDGEPCKKQNWKMENAPYATITDPTQVVVDVPKEVKRFHVAIRRGSGFMQMVLTDGSTRKVKRAVEKAGEQAWYVFDYFTQEAVILVPGETTPLPEYAAKHLTPTPGATDVQGNENRETAAAGAPGE